MPTDITPTVRFKPRPSHEELITPTDDALDAHVWRELAQLALAQLERMTVRCERLTEELRWERSR